MVRSLRVDADLTFSVQRENGGDGPALSGTADGVLRGSLVADGTRLRLDVDDVTALGALGARNRSRSVAAHLARLGLTLVLSGPDGAVVTLGAVPAPWWQRALTRSSHVRVEDWKACWRLWTASAQGRTTTSVAAFVPPGTPLPLAPTFRRRRRPVTTTHDPDGGGRPQLRFALGPSPRADAVQRVHLLRPRTTVIGSGPDVDLHLDGVGDRVAEIRRDEHDEYVLVVLEPAQVTVNGAPVERQVLRTGSRVQIGPWVMGYWREEFADHGRPHGGRSGGEFSHQRPQEIPVYRRPRRRNRPLGPA